MIPKIVKNNLEKLNKKGFSFQSIYEIISSTFSSEVFAEKIQNGQVIKTTYSEMVRMTEKTASGIYRKYSECKSDIIGIYMDNSAEWVYSFWGILKAGFTPLLLNTRQDLSVTNQIIDEIKPAAVITDNSKINGHISYFDVIADAQEGVSEPNWCDKVILVTSGSTQKPKIIVHCGRSICSQIELSEEILKENITLRHNRKLEVRLLAFLPFYHIFGLVTTMMWFTFFGRTLIFLPDYSVDTIQHTCQRMDVSHFFAIPLVWESAVKHLMQEVERQGKMNIFLKMIDFSNRFQSLCPHIGPAIIRNTIFKKIRKQVFGENLHFLISGGGFISAPALKIMNGLGYSLYVGYGLTECGIVAVNITRNAGGRLGSSNGRIFSNIKYRVTDENQLEIEKNSCFIGSYIDGKYVENTQEYYNTNDIVSFDELKHLHIIGRLDDVIITENGENMSPEAVEARINSEGFVSATLVYALIEGKKQVVLALEPNPNDSAAERAAAFTKLFESIDKLPMGERPAQVISIIGKAPYGIKGVDRKKLAKQLSEGQLYFEKGRTLSKEDIEKYSSEEYKTIIEAVKECYREVIGTAEEINDMTDFVSLGGDSMMYVGLLDKISEKIEVDMRLSDKPMITPIDFADYIVSQKNKKG